VTSAVELRLDSVRALLCDADDCLFPSESPAFEASTRVTNQLLADFGVDRRFTPDSLRARALGRNFRTSVLDLAAEHGFAIDDAELERWVDQERREVTAHLQSTLRPDPRVRESLAALASRYQLAAVSSSALRRLDACFDATGLIDLFPAAARYSSEDSLPVPTSKPDPAIYAHAGRELGVTGEEALAIEDSVSGTRSAVLAGFPVIGLVLFVDEPERDQRAAALREAGATAVVASWSDVAALVGSDLGLTVRPDV
jgi:beta-phosphoglucomutase-like phosphatase (HAD superfamily)